MKGYINIPKNIYVKRCKECGARPIIVMAGKGEYIVKCPTTDEHYHTVPGLIDLEDWNTHNRKPQATDYNVNAMSGI